MYGIQSVYLPKSIRANQNISIDFRLKGLNIFFTKNIQFQVYKVVYMLILSSKFFFQKWHCLCDRCESEILEFPYSILNEHSLVHIYIYYNINLLLIV